MTCQECGIDEGRSIDMLAGYVVRKRLKLTICGDCARLLLLKVLDNLRLIEDHITIPKELPVKTVEQWFAGGNL